jgi:RNA polymerase sigma-70 factor (ECF subfamily)
LSTPNSSATDSQLEPNGSPVRHGDNSANARPLGPTRNSSTDCDDLGSIIAVRARDRLAFEKLYLGYYQRLTRFLGRFTIRENIEEIINDTFMVIWMHAKDFRHESKVSTWIIGIAYRTAMRQLRRQRHVSSRQPVGDFSESDDPITDIETKDWLSCALACLPLEQRITVTLAYQMGYSVEEIARITESPLGTVKSRMFHARIKLHEHALTQGGETRSSSSILTKSGTLARRPR